MAYSPGTASCGVWVASRKANSDRVDLRATQMRAFVAGYVTAVNTYVNWTQGDSLHRLDEDGQDAFFDRWCSEHPTDTFVRATIALINEVQKQ